MSFLDNIATLTSTVPNVDPELLGWDDNAFLTSKQSERPYHILDDDNIGIPVARAEMFTVDSPSSDINMNAAAILSERLENQIEEPDDDEDSSGSDEESTENDEDDDDIDMIKAPDEVTDQSKRDAVKFQVASWEKLVQLRLKLQTCLQEASRLPPPEKRAKYVSGEVPQTHRQTILTNLQLVIDKLFDVQDTLSGLNPDVMSAGKKKVIADDEIASDTDEEEDKVEEVDEESKPRKRKQDSHYYNGLMNDVESTFSTFKSDTMLYWYEKTKIVTQKNSFLNKEITVLNQIEHILSNKDRLINRTLQNRGSVRIFGETDLCDSHPYLFNDDDFYQQLLREIIDKKMGSANMGDSETMGRRWVELQKLKIKSKKKSVDTKASKGRKVRYELHSKLLGFMAPFTVDTLSDTRQDELFKSLFVSNS